MNARAARNCARRARCVMSPDSTTRSGRCCGARRTSASTTRGRSVPKCGSDTCSRQLIASLPFGRPAPGVERLSRYSGVASTRNLQRRAHPVTSPSNATFIRAGAAPARLAPSSAGTRSARRRRRRPASPSRRAAAAAASPACPRGRSITAVTGAVTARRRPLPSGTPSCSSCSRLLPTNRVSVRNSRDDPCRVDAAVAGAVARAAA